MHYPSDGRDILDGTAGLCCCNAATAMRIPGLGAPFFGGEPGSLHHGESIGNGTLPMGAVIAQGVVHDASVNGQKSAIELFTATPVPAIPWRPRPGSPRSTSPRRVAC